ncbi:MAG TPA: zf-HC2 domain-containing protein [Thermoleophilaceae bacterium]|nr:zf-HC2 domain-containing protein [Thermoleophilaceae bacterium]
MEHAPLRPVPARPAGPIDPATAAREVEAWLPTLPPATARAFALVVLAERPRAEVAAQLSISGPELGEQLAAARKELRQTVVTLGGSGWCERAEGLISERLDGTLPDRDAGRLDVHLRNCTRCVEHERRLVQATDALILSLGRSGPSPAPPLAEAPPGEAPAAEAPPGEAPPVEAPPQEAPPVEAPPEELPPVEEPPGDGAPKEAPPAGARDRAAPGAAPPAGAPAPTPAQIAAAAEVLVVVRTRRQIAAAVVWNLMIVLAVLLAVAAIALTVAGIMGAEL